MALKQKYLTINISSYYKYKINNMKHYNFKPISNDKVVVGINIDILNINIKKCKLHILPNFTLLYDTINGYVTFDLDWLIFELRLYIVYKYIRNKWRKTKNKYN